MSMKAARVATILVGLTGLVVMVPVVHRSPAATLGGSDERLLVLEAGAALALLTVSALFPRGPAAVLVAAVGAAWLLPEAAGAVGVPLLVRTVSEAVPPLIVAALVVGIALFAARGGTAVEPPLLLAVVGAVVATAARLLLVDPFDQVDCWRTCEHNPLLMGDGTLGVALRWVGLIGMTVGVVWVAVALGRRRRHARRHTSLAGWLLVMGLLLQLLWPAPPTTGRGLAMAVFVNAAAVAWLAVLCRETWLRWRLESRLARWVTLLVSRTDGETLADSLRAAVRDPGLRVAYWAPARQAYVDASGTTTNADPGGKERVTTVTRLGQTVSTIVHRRRVDGARLERALGPALRLALENEQLRAAALAELEELTLSRARVVERAAVERRRLERNLHDGAQQRAVSLALLVRLLPAAAKVEQDARARAEALTRTLTEELRRVARGIYPAVLTDAGLLGAVIDLAEDSTDLPVVLPEFPEGRFPGTIESTAYLVVRAALEDARARRATCASVSGRHDEGKLRIHVEDDAEAPPAGIDTELADQVSALGGELVTVAGRRHHHLEVVLPCAS